MVLSKLLAQGAANEVCDEALEPSVRVRLPPARGAIAAAVVGCGLIVCVLTAVRQRTAAAAVAIAARGGIGRWATCYTHTIDGQAVQTEPTQAVYEALYEQHGGLKHVKGTTTWDSLRYAHHPDFPLCTKFTDAYNHVHEVCIDGATCQFTMYAPVAGEILWHGDDADRTGFDALATVAELQFSYKASDMLHSHSIRVRASGFCPGDAGSVGLGALDEVLVAVNQLAVTGAEVAVIVLRAKAGAFGNSTEGAAT